MNDLTDQQLLQDYSARHTEAAFAALVRRHVDFVYSAAIRMVRDAHLAEDVTQAVFMALAQNARQLTARPALSGWLHRTTQNLAANVVRADVRRRIREQEAATMNELLSSATPDASWEQIAPELDAALGGPSDPDRDALFLRYFEKKSAREIAQILGISDEAAQKRVNRAVDRLRELFSKRKVTVGAGGLVVLISANAIQAAPATLAATITATALASTASTLIAATKTIAMTTLQKTLVTAALTVTISGGIYEARQSAQLRAQNHSLQQQLAPLTAQLQQLQSDRDAAAGQVASLRDELAKTQSNGQELLKLRNEMTLQQRNPASDTVPANDSVSPAQTARNNGPSPADDAREEVGRQLGQAVVRGDADAFKNLLAESNGEREYFRTNRTGLDNRQSDELASRAFAPVNAAFKVIADAATTGNQAALDALTHALQVPGLNGLAIDSLGGLAGNGDPGALEVLTHPEKYGSLLSSTITPLKAAADKGNQPAVDALAAVAADPKDQPLWYITADSLSQAAANGNPAAVDALINISSSTNRTIQNAAISGLKARRRQSKHQAAAALRTLGVQ